MKLSYMYKALANKNSNRLKRFIFSSAAVLSVLFILSPAIASASPSSPVDYVKNIAATPIDCNEGLTREKCGITNYIFIFINVLSAILGIVITISIIVAGIQYSASAGNPQAVEASKKRISNAILALVTFAFMYGFLQWIVPGGIL